jgi:predicted RNA-binding Zn ribbon-like protein
VDEPTTAFGEDRSLTLSLVNTRVAGAGSEFDRLTSTAALTDWIEHRDIRSHHNLTARDLEDFVQLRTDARAVLIAVADHVAPDAAAVQRVNSAAAAVPVKPVLRTDSSTVISAWEPIGVHSPLAEVARDLIGFATSEPASHLRVCAADDCDRLFIQDHGRRIWCSTACGNRMRAKRHYASKNTAGMRSSRASVTGPGNL